MTTINNTDAPIESAAETVDQQVTKSFEILGNDTRLAILLALWEASDPGPPMTETSEPGLSFSELRKRVGMPHSGQFHYHLDKLLGRFVEQTDAGYSLTAAADRILGVILAGSLSDHEPLEAEPLDATCQQCGADAVVIDYRDRTLTKRCTNCHGQFDRPDLPTGVLAHLYRPPAGLANRSPQEFMRAGNTWTRYRMRMIFEGICPDCSGPISTTIEHCGDHHTGDGSICDSCGSAFEVQPHYVCEVCKLSRTGPWNSPPLTDPAVLSFFYEHGIDPDELYIKQSADVLHDAVDEVVPRSTKPIRVLVAYELEGDRLEVLLDSEASVIDVSEVTG